MKTILVTGASGNLGKVVVKEFLDRGHRVITTHSRQPLPASAENIQYVVDLSNDGQVNEMISDIQRRFGVLDAACLLAGGFESGGLEKTDVGAIHRMITMNVDTAFNMARAAYLQMKDQPTGGRIIFIGARPALIPEMGKDHMAYALSKSLLFRMMEQINASHAGPEFKACILVPGTIDTPDNRKWSPDADFSTWVKPETMAEVMDRILHTPANELTDPVFML